MKKIAFLINSVNLGGAERVFITLLENLKNNKSVELICIEKTQYYPIPDGIKVTFLSKMTGKESGLTKLIVLPILAYKLKRHCRLNNISLIQSHIFRANYINILSKLLGSKHIAHIVIHGVISEYLKKGILGKINLFLIKYLYPRAEMIIANSKGVRNDLQNIFNFKNPIVIIYNPFDVKQIQQESLEPLDANDFQMNPKIKYIISVGRLIKGKRQGDLINAFKLISKSHKDCELIFLGDGNNKNSLVSLSKKLDITDKVHFLGNVPNPYKYLSRSVLSVLASESESFGNVLVESMICKCPVISSNCKFGPQEILSPANEVNIVQIEKDIEYAENGLLVPVGDIKNLAKAMKLLLENKELCKKYIDKAYQRSKDFDVDKIIQFHKKYLFYN